MTGFQFSIRMLMAATAAVALGAWLCVSEPSWWLGLVGAVISVILPVFCGIAYAEATGRAKAFWLGTRFVVMLSAAGYLLFLLWACGKTLTIPIDGWDMKDVLAAVSGFLRLFVPLWALAPVVGLLSSAFHWFLVRGKRSNEER